MMPLRLLLALVLTFGVIASGCAGPIEGISGSEDDAGAAGGSGGSTSSGGSTGTGGLGGLGGSAGISGTGGNAIGHPDAGSDSAGGTTGTGGAAGRGGTSGAAGAAGASGGAGGRGTTAGAGGTQGGAGTSGGGGVGGAGNGGSAGMGTAGSGGGTACAVAPVDPAATQQVRSLLCYLHDISGNHVLSGQQETSWSNPAADITYYVTNLGKYPAILGGDYLYPNGTTSRALAYWQAGGLTMIRYHMGAPPLADTFANSETATNYARVLTSGTAENASLHAKLDYLAGELKTLQDAHVAVILALYHEVQPNGWFWWAMGTGQQFVQLWQLSFNYLTQTKGIHNVIWLLPFSGSPSAAYFPGKAWVDISGPDEYANPGNQPFASNYRSAVSAVGTTIPIPLHETGAVPQPASMFPSAAPWLLWNIWAGYQRAPQNGTTFNTVSSLMTAYSSPFTITRDEVPKF